MSNRLVGHTLVACFFVGMLVTSLALPAIMFKRVYAEQQSITINGAGATFPFPLIDTWRAQYQKINPNVNLNYQSIGSGGGVKQFNEKTVDFGASDAPLSDTERNSLPSPAVHIPETIGSVVVAYNVPGIGKGLKITGPILAEIFLGKIKKWNDPQIASVNPGISLPAQDIAVVHRSDGSGTTFVWTDYLSAVSADWKSQVGKGKSVQWPVGRGAPGNEGVANTISQSPYTLGYVELAYALTTKMTFADIQNKEGNFVTPSLESTKAAVKAASTSLPAGDASWASVSMVNAPGASSYPIASFTYLLLYKDMSANTKIDSEAKAKALVDFIAWAIGPDGQKYAAQLSYVPLPDDVVQLDMKTLSSLTYKGQKLIVQQPQSSSVVSATFEGKTYPVKITSSSAVASNSDGIIVTINPGQSIGVQLLKPGDVQITFPKTMIDGIQSVSAGDQQVDFKQLGSTTTDTTIGFTVPQDAKMVTIKGATVVPEFGVIAAVVLALSIVAVIGVRRLTGNIGTGLNPF